MRISAMLLCATYLIGQTHAQTLSDADREALLDNLEKLREAATSRVDGKYRVALTAFSNAMTSDDEAIKLYLNCYEKVNYDDQQKKSQEFRDWKRKEVDKLADPTFRKALRLQLGWLCITLQAASDKPDMPRLTREAMEVVDAVFREAQKLAPQEQLLSQGITATVFAKAYDINHVKAEAIPSNPIQLEQFYEQLILPPLRNSSHLPALRSAWLKRIEQECAKRQFWGREGKKGAVAPPSGPDYEKFLVEGFPQLQWQMEVDLFSHGDESTAAVHMLAILQKNINHPSARDWGEQFKTLLTPKAPVPPTPPTAAAP